MKLSNGYYDTINIALQQQMLLVMPSSMSFYNKMFLTTKETGLFSTQHATTHNAKTIGFWRSIEFDLFEVVHLSSLLWGAMVGALG